MNPTKPDPFGGTPDNWSQTVTTREYVSEVIVRWGDFGDVRAVLWEEGGMDIHRHTNILSPTPASDCDWKVTTRAPDGEIVTNLEAARDLLDRMITRLTR
jgi:hypothetical protein